MEFDGYHAKYRAQSAVVCEKVHTLCRDLRRPEHITAAHVGFDSTLNKAMLVQVNHVRSVLFLFFLRHFVEVFLRVEAVRIKLSKHLQEFKLISPIQFHGGSYCES